MLEYAGVATRRIAIAGVGSGCCGSAAPKKVSVASAPDVARRARPRSISTARKPAPPRPRSSAAARARDAARGDGALALVRLNVHRSLSAVIIRRLGLDVAVDDAHRVQVGERAGEVEDERRRRARSGAARSPAAAPRRSCRGSSFITRKLAPLASTPTSTPVARCVCASSRERGLAQEARQPALAFELLGRARSNDREHLRSSRARRGATLLPEAAAHRCSTARRPIRCSPRLPAAQPRGPPARVRSARGEGCASRAGQASRELRGGSSGRRRARVEPLHALARRGARGALHSEFGRASRRRPIHFAAFDDVCRHVTDAVRRRRDGGAARSRFSPEFHIDRPGDEWRCTATTRSRDGSSGSPRKVRTHGARASAAERPQPRIEQHHPVGASSSLLRSSRLGNSGIAAEPNAVGEPPRQLEEVAVRRVGSSAVGDGGLHDEAAHHRAAAMRGGGETMESDGSAPLIERAAAGAPGDDDAHPMATSPSAARTSPRRTRPARRLRARRGRGRSRAVLAERSRRAAGRRGRRPRASMSVRRVSLLRPFVEPSSSDGHSEGALEERVPVASASGKGRADSRSRCCRPSTTL